MYQGPPRTGKITTMDKVLKVRTERAVLSAPANAATANIAFKVFRLSKIDMSLVCVFVDDHQRLNVALTGKMCS